MIVLKEQKMKKIFLIMIIVVLFLFPSCEEIPNSNSTIESEHSMLNEFCIDDYQEEIQIFHCDKTTEPVKNEFDAEKIAEEIWLDYSGQEILQEKPFVVFYDKANNAWLVQSTLPEDLLGGSAYIIIKGISGEILAVWREK